VPYLADRPYPEDCRFLGVLAEIAESPGTGFGLNWISPELDFAVTRKGILKAWSQ
jgi:hypothetical protein